MDVVTGVTIVSATVTGGRSGHFRAMAELSGGNAPGRGT